MGRLLWGGLCSGELCRIDACVERVSSLTPDPDEYSTSARNTESGAAKIYNRRCIYTPIPSRHTHQHTNTRTHTHTHTSQLPVRLVTGGA